MAKEEISEPQIFQVYRQTRKVRIPYYFLSLLLIASSGFVYYYYNAGIMSIIPAAIGFVIILIQEIYLRIECIKLKSDGITREKGILSRVYSSINYDDIIRLNVYQTFLGRILNYGTIRIDVSGSEEAEMIIRNISRPLKAERKIRQIWNEYIKGAKNEGVSKN